MRPKSSRNFKTKNKPNSEISQLSGIYLLIHKKTDTHTNKRAHEIQYHPFYLVVAHFIGIQRAYTHTHAHTNIHTKVETSSNLCDKSKASHILAHSVERFNLTESLSAKFSWKLIFNWKGPYLRINWFHAQCVNLKSELESSSVVKPLLQFNSCSFPSLRTSTHIHRL